VVDNVDHNIRTLDGTGSFHGMGMIAVSVRSAYNYTNVDDRIARLKKRISASELVAD
jgi:hypothetical protein